MYPRGSNPRVDHRICKKSLAYAEEQVESLLADWVDPLDHRKGIVAREFLPSGRVIAAQPSDFRELKTRFVPNCRFSQPDRPTHYENENIAAVRILPKSVVLESWDWLTVPVTA